MSIKINKSVSNNGIGVNGLTIPKSFFGMHIQFPSTPFHEDLGFGTIRLWDTKTSWRHLEGVSKGQWTWTTLDSYVNQAIAKGLDIVLTLGQTPTWASGGVKSDPQGWTDYNGISPTNIQDWRDYITTVATRYKGKIKYYEVWNEPNESTFWTGTVAQMVTLTSEAFTTLHSVDPNAKLLSPCYTGDYGVANFDTFLSSGGAGYFDIASIHLYVFPLQPERMISVTKMYRDTLIKYNVNVPIWNTEAGYGNYYLDGVLKDAGDASTDVNMMPDNLASSYIARFYLSSIIAGLERSFYYGMDYQFNRLRMVNLANKTQVLAGGNALKKLTSWLTNAVITDYKIDCNTYYLTVNNSGKVSTIMWNTDGNSKYSTIQDNSVITSYDTLLNGTQYPDVNGNVSVTNQPILFSTQKSLVNIQDNSILNKTYTKEMLYNGDFSLYLTSSTIPTAWIKDSAVTVVKYTGLDAPDKTPLTINTTTQWTGMKQATAKRFKKNKKYRLSVTYRYDGTGNPWIVDLESGVWSSLLRDDTDYTILPNKLTQTLVRLTPTNGFETHYVDFVFNRTDDETSPNINVKVVNSTTNYTAVNIAKISIQELDVELKEEYPARVIYSPLKPTAGTWQRGDIVYFTDVDLINSEGNGWICTQAGTFGTLSALTGTVTSGNPTLTVNTTGILKIGDRIKVGTDAINAVTWINGNNITLENNATTANTNATIVYSAPVFKRLTPVISSGTANPTGGSNGDIYLQYT